MRIAIVGTGYVGLVTGACLSETGAHVVCIDVDASKVDRLRRGEIPIFEPGLDLLVSRNVAKRRLEFTTSLADGLDKVDVVFIAVGTPPGADGSADLSQVLEVARQIGTILATRSSEYVVVVTKSTVPVGTAKRMRETIREAIQAGAVDGVDPAEFDVASNPEFLKEGAAIEDFAKPDRIVIGVDSDRARAVLERVYRPFLLNGRPVLFMDVPSAEITKYAANAMLATRISFMNQMAELCETVGADVNMVRRGIGSDPRIGSSFLYAGAGYGGSCFPKDVRALSTTMKALGIPAGLLDAVEAINTRQKARVFDKVCQSVGRPVDGSLAGITVGVWGIAFKPNTDDVRDAPALEVIARIVAAGGHVRAYDPVAAIPPAMAEGVTVCDVPLEAARSADVLVLMSEWSEFRSPDFAVLGDVMSARRIVDARNVLSVEDANDAGFTIVSIGTPQAL